MTLHCYYSNSGEDLILDYVNNLPENEGCGKTKNIKIDNLKFLNDNEQQVNSSNYRQDEAVVDN